MKKRIFIVLVLVFVIPALFVILIGFGFLFADQRWKDLFLDIFGCLQLIVLFLLFALRFIPTTCSLSDESLHNLGL